MPPGMNFNYCRIRIVLKGLEYSCYKKSSIEKLFHTVVAELMANWVKNFANSVHGLKDAAPVGLLEDGERC